MYRIRAKSIIDPATKIETCGFYYQPYLAKNYVGCRINLFAVLTCRVSKCTFFFLLRVLLIVLITIPAIAEGKASVIPLDSGLYEEMDTLYRLAGQSPGSNTRPWTIWQAFLYLQQLDQSRLGAAGMRLYEQVFESLSAPPQIKAEGFFFDAYPEINIEVFGSSESGYLDEIRSYGERSPFFSAPLRLGLDDVLTIQGDIDFVGDYGVASKEPWKYTNAVVDPTLWDWQLPFRAYVSSGGEHWSVSLGRDQMQWGPGHAGQILVSDQADFYESLNATIFWDFFRYTMTYVDMEPWARSGALDWYFPDNAADQLVYRSFFNHRFEFKPAPFLSFAINEGYMLDTLFPELKYFNPFMIFHSFTEWYKASSLFGLDFSLAPVPGLEMYGQIAWNQIQLAYETDVYNVDSMANAMAYMIGAETSIDLDAGFIGGGMEWVMTDPYMYLRESPRTSYVYRRRIFSNSLGGGVLTVVSEPMGFRYGNDAMTFAAWASWEEPGKYAVALDWLTLAKGEMDLDSPFDTGSEAVARKTPTGNPWFLNQLSLQAWVRPWNFMVFDAFVALGNNENYRHKGRDFLEFSWSLGASLDFVALFSDQGAGASKSADTL